MKTARINLRVNQEIVDALNSYAHQRHISQAEAHRRILSDALLRPTPPTIIPVIGTVDKEGKVIYFRQKEAA